MVSLKLRGFPCISFPVPSHHLLCTYDRETKPLLVNTTLHLAEVLYSVCTFSIHPYTIFFFFFLMYIYIDHSYKEKHARLWIKTLCYSLPIALCRKEREIQICMCVLIHANTHVYSVLVLNQGQQF